MFTLAQLLCALLLPAALAALLAAYTRRLHGSAGCLEPGLGGLQLAVTVVVAHAAAAAAVDARLIFPLMAWHWLPWAGLALVAVFACAAPRAGGSAWRWALQALVAGGGALLLLRPMTHALGVEGIAAWTAAVIASVLLTGWTVSARPAGALVEHVTAAIATGAVAIGAGLTGSKDLALLALIVPLAVVGSGLLHLSRGSAAWAGGTLAAAHFLAWHLVINSTMSEMPWWCALLLALPLPAGALVARLSRSRTAAVWRIAVTIVFALLALGAAATLGQPPSSASDEPNYAY